MYIKIKDNIIDKYPYSEGQLKSDNPQVSFPQTISKAILAEYGVYEVTTIEVPSITYKQNVEEGTPELVDSVWKQVWNVTDKSVDEINAIHESNRKEAYKEESDPLFFKWQRGEIDKQVWLDKVAEIKQRWS
jgi:hypothetical protein